MITARTYALASALMSLAYLLSIPAILVFLFLDWRVSIGLIPVAASTAVFAKWLNGRKLQAVYGNTAGKQLNELDWQSGRRLDP